MNSIKNQLVTVNHELKNGKAAQTMSIIGGVLFFPYGLYRLAKHLNSQESETLYNQTEKEKVEVIERIIKFTPKVSQQIEKTIGTFPAEQGGMLGSSDGGKTIDHFYWDRQADTSKVTYTPNVELINNEILPKWNASGISLVGFVHSHPLGFMRPSGGDIVYAKRLLKALDEDRLYLPIVQSRADGTFAIYGFAAEANGDELPKIQKYVVLNQKQEQGINHIKRLDETPKKLVAAFHSRVEEIYPLSIMSRKTVIVPGCGGAGDYIENLARTGIGKIILFDGDNYSDTNLATQSVYRDEIGQNKAMALKKRIERINPEIQVIAIPNFLDDKISDQNFEAVIGSQLIDNPCDILMTACTDSFSAQARCAKLAMKYGMPFMAAQLYEKGLASEIIFTYPGVTPACPRCLLASRYDAYLKHGYKNTVGSHQTPIFATARTNSLKGYISLMLLLYHEVKDNPFYNLLEQVKDRNFINIRMSNSYDSPIFKRELDASPYTFFDETLWLTQTPDNGENESALCPECQGNGDLRLLIGKIDDTRKII